MVVMGRPKSFVWKLSPFLNASFRVSNLKVFHFELELLHFKLKAASREAS